jgi:hypothetical protein
MPVRNSHSVRQDHHRSGNYLRTTLRGRVIPQPEPGAATMIDIRGITARLFRLGGFNDRHSKKRFTCHQRP